MKPVKESTFFRVLSFTYKTSSCQGSSRLYCKALTSDLPDHGPGILFPSLTFLGVLHAIKSNILSSIFQGPCRFNILRKEGLAYMVSF
jgi:hypothetical protein